MSCQAYQELKEDWKNEERTVIIRQMIREGLDKAIILKCTQCTEAEYAKAAKTAKG